MKKSVTLLMVAGLFVGLTFSGEDSDKEVRKSEKQIAAPVEKGALIRPERPSLAGRPVRGPVDMQQRYQQMLTQRAEIHKQAIDELEEIKKIAQEEGATRTVEALQKMIDNKNAEHKKSIQNFTRMQRERADQIRQRTGKPVLNVEKGKEAASQKEPVK